MYSKLNLMVHKIASKNSIKEELKTVAFEGNRTRATDSFKVLEIGNDSERTDTTLLGAKTVAKLASNPELFNRLMKHLPTVEAKPADTDMAFADFAKKRNAGGSATVSVNAEYLEQILGILKRMDRHKKVLLTVPVGEGQPVFIEAVGDEGTYGRALVMTLNK